MGRCGFSARFFGRNYETPNYYIRHIIEPAAETATIALGHPGLATAIVAPTSIAGNTAQRVFNSNWYTNNLLQASRSGGVNPLGYSLGNPYTPIPQFLNQPYSIQGAVGGSNSLNSNR